MEIKHNKLLYGILSFFIIIIVNIQVLADEGNTLREDAKYVDWMTFYYVQKDTSRVVDYLAWLEYSEILEKHVAVQPPVSAFLSVLFTDNPSHIKEWVEAVKFSGEAQKIVQHALWLSGNAKLIKELSKKMPEYAKNPSTGILLAEPEIPSDLDMYWGAFSASGDVAYIHKVVDALKEFENPPAKPREGMDMRAAAAWSLGANMAQHELAIRVVLDEIKTRPDAVKIVLNDVLEQFKRKAIPFDHKDGEFSAKLLVLDEEGLKEYQKTQNKANQHTKQHKEVSRVKHDDVIAIKILFSGMALTQDLSADVKYDIKLIKPDGSVYNATERNGLPALEGKVPSRFRIFNTPSSLMVQFEPKDKVGVYKVVAEIRDNVGQKRIALSKEIELVE